MLDVHVNKYYSENGSMLELRYDYLLHIEDANCYVTYIDCYGRNCKMSAYKNNNGYLWTSLALKNHKRKSCRINRLVYSNIFGEIPYGYEVDHKDRNRLNNEPSNLRLLSKHDSNLNKNIKGENNPFSVLSEKEVKEILELVLSHKMTKQAIAERYNVSFSTIKAIRSGHNWLYLTKDIFDKYGIMK